MDIALPDAARAGGELCAVRRQRQSRLHLRARSRCRADGLKYVGTVGKDISLEDGKAAARLCAINVIAQVKAACGGDLDRVKRCVKVDVFVNAVPGFTQHPEVANGASDLFVEVFGDAGKHARAAVGAGSLPRNVATEVEAVFEIA